MSAFGLTGVFGAISNTMLRHLRDWHAENLGRVAEDPMLLRLCRARRWDEVEARCEALHYVGNLVEAGRRLASNDTGPDEARAAECTVHYETIRRLRNIGSDLNDGIRQAFKRAAVVCLLALAGLVAATWASESWVALVSTVILTTLSLLWAVALLAPTWRVVHQATFQARELPQASTGRWGNCRPAPDPVETRLAEMLARAIAYILSRSGPRA